MNSSTQNECSEARLGNLIAPYELGLANDKDRASFEEHLFDCALCRKELESFRPAASLLSANRDELSALIRAEEPAFAPQIAQVVHPSLLDYLKRAKATLDDALDTLLKPRILAPVLSSAALIAIIVMVISTNERTANEAFLVWQPLQYKKMVLMGEQKNPGEALFQKAMESYTAGDYKQAVESLNQAIKLEPANVRFKTYLGVSYFMLKKPKEALRSLTEAERMTQYAFKDELHWFIFQSYLLSGDLARADSMRSLMAASRESYLATADSIWTVLQADKKR